MLKMCIQTDQVNVSKYVSIFYVFSICLTCFYSIIEEILVSSSSGNREWHIGQTELETLAMHKESRIYWGVL